MSGESILLLGGSGYVGNAFAELFEDKGIRYHALSRAELDYTQAGVLSAYLKEHKYTFLLCSAGYTGKPNVDACELHRYETLLGNAVLPGIVREACEGVSLPWGYVSSGCIYSGRREDGGGFTEEDEPNFSFRQGPCSFYSGAKALGEELLVGAENCYVWRLRIPFNHIDSPRNYISKMMRYDRLLDVENSLSHLGEFVASCFECWEKRVPFGIYNMTNPGSVTTRQVVDKIVAAGLSNKRFSYFESIAEFMEVAANAHRSNCVLDTQKLEAVGIRMRPVEEALDDALSRWSAK